MRPTMNTLRCGRSLYKLVMLSALLVVDKSLCAATNSPEEGQVYLAGKAQYESIMSKSEMPQFGTCWKQALGRATAGCKHLTNTITHQLAYDFTRCFYLELGQDIPECTVLPESCKEHLDKNVLHGTYAMFFMHTRDMCYFLENQAWQEKTQETVIQLSDSSQQVVQRLANAQSLQEKIAAGQEETLTRQQSIINGSDSLSAKISTMQIGVVGLLTEFQQTYTEQMLAVGHVFDKISSLENIFLAEYTGTQAFLLWLGALLISYLTSSTPRTYAARFPLFLLTLIFAVLELTVVNHSFSHSLCRILQKNSLSPFTDITVCVYLCTKTWRWFYGVCNILVLLYFAISYEDYDSKIYRALLDLQNDIKVMKATYGQSPMIEGALTDSNEIPATNAAEEIPVKVISRSDAAVYAKRCDSDLSVAGYEDNTSGSDCESDSTYLTSANSTSSLSTDATGLSDFSVSELGSSEVTAGGKSAMLKRTLLNRTSEVCASPTNSRYNLRPRNFQSTPNKLVIDETERQFVRAVKQLTKHKGRFPNSSYML